MQKFIAMAIVITCLALLTFTRNLVWLTEVSLLVDSIKKSPLKTRPIENFAYQYILDSPYVKDVDTVKNELQIICASIKLDDLKIYTILGNAYLRLHSYENAYDAFIKTLSLDPNNIVAYNNLATVSGLRGDYITALELSKKALSLNPEDNIALNNMGLAYASMGRHRDAIPIYKRSLDFDPFYRPAHYNLGLSYLAVSQKQFALNEYNILVKINPSHADKLMKAIRSDVE